jgi:arabinan endo-1,5-alpha-L-arabinosidase
MTFSALSSDGVAIWGSRLLKKTDAQVVAAVSGELSLGNTSAITSNLTLPTDGARDSVISWASSNPAIVSTAGIIKRPKNGAGDALVTLTATITKGTATTTKSFVVVVREETLGGLIARYAFDGNLAEATGVLASGTVSGSKIDQAGGSLTYTTGVQGSAAVFNGSTGVRLPNGIITKNTYTVSLWVNPDQLTEFSPTFFGAKNSDSWVSLLPKGHAWVNNASMVWSGTAWYDAGLGMNIPVGQWSHLVFTVNNGALNVYVNGVKKFSGTGFPNVFTTNTGVFSLGVNWWDAPYKGLMDELRIYEVALTADQVASMPY